MQKNVCTKTWKISQFFLEFSSAILLHSSFSRLCWPYFAWLLGTSELIHWLAFVWYYKNNLTLWHFGARQRLLFYLMKQFLMSFAFVDVSSIFDSLADSLMHPARINQKRHVVQAEEIYSEVWYKCSSSPRRLRRPRAASFIKSGTCKQISRAIQKLFIFPPKNLQKIRVHCCFLSNSVSNIFTNLLNFPAKRLRKNTAPKIRMRQFF